MSDQPLTLLIIDNDPIFGLGLTAALEDFESIQVLDQANTPKDAFKKLAEQSFNIILLEPELSPNSSATGWQLCQGIKRRYPQQKICLLSQTDNFKELSLAREGGIEGYCPKGVGVAQLVGILEQINQGDTYWHSLSIIAQVSNQRLRRPWLSQLRQSGIEQINRNLTAINQQLNLSSLPLVDRFFWQGRKRELVTARWLVKQLLPVEVITIEERTNRQEYADSPRPDEEIIFSEDSIVLVPSPVQRPYLEIVFDNTLKKIQGNLKNATGYPLEIDILQSEKSQGLLFIVFQQISQLFDQMKFAELTASQLPVNLGSLFDSLWQNCTITFLSKYGILSTPYTLDEIQERLGEDIDLIQEEILEKIPFLKELFDYVLFEKGLKIQGVDYRPESPEAMEQAEYLLQNTIIQIANAVMIFILNNFSEQEEIKDSLYREKLLSSREIAKFRNDLSWQYRLDKYWETPKNIFESQYRVYYINPKGLQSTDLYFPRQGELEQLQGLPRVVTLGLEIRDAMAPRLRSVTGWLGEGLVYVLTQVIGRAIGLVGRGIIQGVGTTWQETRYGKNNRQD
ncbi:MAG: DUF3685 domain-containing protein [Microcystaceae cyanobacterium]